MEKKEQEKETKQEPQKKATIPEREEHILKFWKEHKIFEQSLEATKEKEPYVFYDGPPFATGLPHHGHLLQGTIKDIIPRYQTMRGRYVRRQWGWDCHGLPIENLIEKELGLKNKQDIEEYGIAKFNQKARESVLRYDAQWRAIVERMGRWVDMEHEYKTMDASYTESVWWAFKTLHDKKLIYEGYKSMHMCPRCGTTLAASEVAQGYKDVKDISVYVKFELADEPGTYFLAWTTTPWTLPGNVALAVGSDVDYSLLQIEEGETVQKCILATNLIEKMFGIALFAQNKAVTEVLKSEGGVEKRYKILEQFKGKDLVGKSYKPVFDDYAKDETLEHHANGWKVYAADFVTTESGTGIVHIAPAFGEDDMELGKKMKLPFVQHVGMDGIVKPEVKALAGMPVKPKSDDDKVRLATDIAVLKYLQERGSFFAKENITHSYPHCWRCDTPLLNYAASSWFVNVTAIKPRLIEENKEVSWVPDNIRDGRFGKWLEGARDWAISRSRYWGAPIPVWRCNKCGKLDVYGSLEDLRTHAKGANTYMVMRHGEAETNTRGIVSYKPEDNYPLTEKGVLQVKSAAAKLKDKGIDLIITSPVLRTKQTAAIVRDTLGLPPDALLEDPRIAEVNTGDLSGCAIESYRSLFTSTLEKFEKPAPGGETLAQMKDRIGEFCYAMEQKYKGKRILIIAHEYSIWLMDAVAKGATNGEAAMMRVLEGEDYVGNAEVRDFSFVPIPHNERYELDYHRPFIDEIRYHCTCELGMLERVPEVFDCWFESGSMPYAQFHYMGENNSPEEKAFRNNFPADFIAEGLDQTRGWFYTMLVLSVGLFDRAAYKSVVLTGLILAEDGQKMSKKLKNYPDPMELAEKYGADALRFYMVSSPVVRGEELRFAAPGVDEVLKKIIMRLDNVHAFYTLYVEALPVLREEQKSMHVLDRWIVARFREVHAEVTHYLDTHELDRATRPIPEFIDDLSTWYLRRSRERFKSDDAEDRACAIATTGWILLETVKLLAPFMPFIAEDLYQKLSIESKKESVHLETWSDVGIALPTVLEEMAKARAIVSQALELRAKAGIKVRQPLARLEAPKLSDALKVIVADEVNVKEVVEGKEVTLDTVITPELKEEGELRDVIRTIQDMRKAHSLVPSDKITLTIVGDKALLALVTKHKATLIGSVNASALYTQEGEAKITIEKN